MAPRPTRRGEDESPQAFHELGVRGRKTGAVLQDTGQRDEHGMQLLDDIFSPPPPDLAAEQEAHHVEQYTSESDGGAPMDIESSAGPGPQTLLKPRQSRFSIPQSRSPRPTSLKSPPKRPSVPLHDTSISDPRNVSISRKLDFAKQQPRPSRSPAIAQQRPSPSQAAKIDTNDADHADAADLDGHDLEIEDMVDQSMQMFDAMQTDPIDQGSEPWFGGQRPNPTPQSAKAKGKQRAAPMRPPPPPPPVLATSISPNNDYYNDDDDDSEENLAIINTHRSPQPPIQSHRPMPPPPKPQSHSQSQSQSQPPKPQTSIIQPQKGKRGRPRKNPELGEPSRPASHTTDSTSVPQKRPRGRPPLNPNAKRRPGRPRKSDVEYDEDDDDDAGEASFMAIQRGPPMPKSRGLVSVRRDANGMQQTRSGRHSYRPVDWWRGEQVVLEDQIQDDMFYNNGDFVLPTMKEIVRVPELEQPSKRPGAGRPKGQGKANHQGYNEEEEDLEDWEISPGSITGEVILWEPQHEEDPPADDDPIYAIDERLALAANAIQTTSEGSFSYATTLRRPFMGAGVVDLPPGGAKKLKNSRKMQMVFFVHYGKVLVTVNESQFRISTGGMWFVPRGNYYGITNDSATPCRVFFAQANEYLASATETPESPEPAS